jgi:hypothetical protein
MARAKAITIDTLTALGLPALATLVPVRLINLLWESIGFMGGVAERVNSTARQASICSPRG